MKKFQQTIVAASLALIAFSSCKKESTEQPVTPPINASSKLTKLEQADGSSEIGYNADGSIKEIVNRLPNGNIMATLNFNYENGRVKEITYGITKIRYTYTAGLVTKMERINSLSGTIMHKNEFSYSNTQLAETIEYWPDGNGGLKPFGRTMFNYNNGGNVTRADLYDFINNAWAKTGEIRITEYDSKKNTSSIFENFIYLPGIEFCKNNPLKEEHVNEQGTVAQTVTHSYLYDARNRPTQRTSTSKILGLADMVETTKFYY